VKPKTGIKPFNQGKDLKWLENKKKDSRVVVKVTSNPAKAKAKPKRNQIETVKTTEKETKQVT